MAERVLRSPATLAALCAFLDPAEVIIVSCLCKATTCTFHDPDFWLSLFCKRHGSDCCPPQCPPVMETLASSPSLVHPVLPPMTDLIATFLLHPWRRILIEKTASMRPGCYPLKHMNPLAWEIGGFPFGLRPSHCNASFMSCAVALFGIDLRKLGIGTAPSLRDQMFDIEISLPARPDCHWFSLSIHLFDAVGNEMRNLVLIATSPKKDGCILLLSDMLERPTYIEVVSVEDSCASSKGSSQLPPAVRIVPVERIDTVEILTHCLRATGFSETPRPEQEEAEDLNDPFEAFDYKLDYWFGTRNIERSQYRILSETSRLLVKVFDSRKQRFGELLRFTKKHPKMDHMSCLDNHIELAAIKLKGSQSP
eukprot:Protomagalhaensia_wolfi_Nauph_80__5184@NODE_554_length_2307_cov_65_844797_g413_i0_p1_GENE_NODE_554_length_2307_cov_65_844797_g413_i0NODE_554_length_2307_cov_65_844797_g413_i0_p1_ORF_typecomplete_len366_score36_85_NODE_554_length_2307_cov_65_844797_g413_i02921389